ncbi:MAG: hypothetical protein IKR05_08435 [Prevotella sp.]|nr:hypothetical protein [Prevotella sp.]
MTHNIQTSNLFTHAKLQDDSRHPFQIFQVIVNTEEDGSFEYEVEADSFHEAVEKAEEMANSLTTDITYIEVYNFD